MSISPTPNSSGFLATAMVGTASALVTLYALHNLNFDGFVVDNGEDLAQTIFKSIDDFHQGGSANATVGPHWIVNNAVRIPSMTAVLSGLTGLKPMESPRVCSVDSETAQRARVVAAFRRRVKEIGLTSITKVASVSAAPTNSIGSITSAVIPFPAPITSIILSKAIVLYEPAIVALRGNITLGNRAMEGSPINDLAWVVAAETYLPGIYSEVRSVFAVSKSWHIRSMSSDLSLTHRTDLVVHKALELAEYRAIVKGVRRLSRRSTTTIDETCPASDNSITVHPKPTTHHFTNLISYRKLNTSAVPPVFLGQQIRHPLGLNAELVTCLANISNSDTLAHVIVDDTKGSIVSRLLYNVCTSLLAVYDHMDEPFEQGDFFGVFDIRAGLRNLVFEGSDNDYNIFHPYNDLYSEDLLHSLHQQPFNKEQSPLEDDLFLELNINMARSSRHGTANTTSMTMVSVLPHPYTRFSQS